MDDFNQGLMVGRYMDLAERTADEVIALRQRVDKLESSGSPKPSQPVNRILLAATAVLSTLLANLKAEDVGGLIAGLIRGMGSH